MKTIIFCLCAALLTLSLIPGQLKAAVPEPVKTQTSSQSAQAEILIQRLEVIKSMNKSTLSRAEKKALRKEVRSIDKQLRDFSGGIYISASALIIILILLIIFT